MKPNAAYILPSSNLVSTPIMELKKKKKKKDCCEKFKRKKGKFCKDCPCNWA